MPAKCAICGVETKIEAALHAVRDKHTNRVTRYCPDCWHTVRTRRFKTFLLGCATTLILGVVFVAADAENGFGWFLLNFLLFYVCLIVAAVPHEFGHAFAAKVVGFRVFNVVIGSGRMIFQRTFSGFNFQIKSIPLGGHVFACPRNVNQYRSKTVLFALAGPLANLLVAGLLVILVPGSAFDFDLVSGIRPASVLLSANLFAFGYIFWPRVITLDGRETPNDALIIWRTLRRKQPEIQGVPVFYYLYEGAECMKGKLLQEGMDWFEKGLLLFPGEQNLLRAKGVACLYQKRFPDAREIYQILLGRADLPPFFRTYCLNDLAYVSALMGGEESLKEADRYSQEALESIPFIPSFKGTRGSVLVERGCYEEGIVLLKEAMAKNDETISKALNSAHIAIAEQRRGNMAEAEKFAALARSLDPDCILLDRLVS